MGGAGDIEPAPNSSNHVRSLAVTMRKMYARWQQARIGLLVCTGLLIASHHVTILSLFDSWSRDPFGHGYFVFPVAAYLAWTRREQIRVLDPRPCVAALPAIGLLSTLWLLGNLTGTISVQQCSVIAMIVAVPWLVLGTAATRAMAFPLSLLLFASPVGDRVAPILQGLTTWTTTVMLGLSTIPVTAEGHSLAIAGTTWRVTEACGGINYVMACLAVAYVYAGVTYRGWNYRAALVSAALAVSFGGNCIRVYTTILLDHLGASAVASGMTHELYGVFVFAVMVTVLFVSCGRWHETQTVERGSKLLGDRLRARSVRSRADAVLCVTVGMLLIASGPAAAHVLSSDHHPEASLLSKSPFLSGPWKEVEAKVVPWPRSFVTPKIHFSRTYQARQNQVELLLASCDGPRKVATMESPDNMFDDATSSVVRDWQRTIESGGRSFPVRESVVRSTGSSFLVWDWYEIGGRKTASRFVAKLLFAESMLRGGRECRAVAVATMTKPDVNADHVLEQFLSDSSFEN